MIQLKFRLIKFYETYIIPNMGICLTLISQLFNSFMIMVCKILITDKDFETPMHPLQILFVRMTITYIFCIFYFTLYEKNPDFPLGPKGYRFLLFLRSFGGFIGVGGQYWSLIYLNVSDTICITFLAPTVTSFMAYLFLGERFTKVEAIGGFVAFFGVILIAKPHFLLSLFSSNDNNDINNDSLDNLNLKLIGSCFAFFSTFGTAIAMCSIRKIGFNAHPLFMVSTYALFTAVVSFLGIILLPGLSFQIPHTLKQWSLLTAIGITGFIMQFLLTAGMQREKAARAIAMTYTQLIYASIFDFTVNGKIPQGWSLIGEIIIVCAVFSIVYFKEPEAQKVITTVPETALDLDLERDYEMDTYKDNPSTLPDDDSSDKFQLSSDSE